MRGGITKQIIDSGVVALGDNDYESGVINVPANSTLVKGAVLKRAGEKFAPLTDDEEVPVAINPFDIVNDGNAADIALRAIVSGLVRADLVTVDSQPLSTAQRDLIRANTLINPILVNDISHVE